MVLNTHLHSPRWYRIASGWLLLSSGIHAALHYSFFIANENTTPRRQQLIQALTDYVLYPPLGTTMWTLLSMFSLSFAALLMVLGVANWWLASECEPRALQRHAYRHALLFALSTAFVGWLHPVAHALLIFSVAALLFSIAAYTLRASHIHTIRS